MVLETWLRQGHVFASTLYSSTHFCKLVPSCIPRGAEERSLTIERSLQMSPVAGSESLECWKCRSLPYSLLLHFSSAQMSCCTTPLYCARNRDRRQVISKGRASLALFTTEQSRNCFGECVLIDFGISIATTESIPA